jgi:hypothetical protein
MGELRVRKVRSERDCDSPLRDSSLTLLHCGDLRTMLLHGATKIASRRIRVRNGIC